MLYLILLLVTPTQDAIPTCRSIASTHQTWEPQDWTTEKPLEENNTSTESRLISNSSQQAKLFRWVVLIRSHKNFINLSCCGAPTNTKGERDTHICSWNDNFSTRPARLFVHVWWEFQCFANSNYASWKMWRSETYNFWVWIVYPCNTITCLA